MIKDNVDLVNLRELIDRYYIKLPSFQRAYTWDKKEIRQFLDDLERYAINERYFVGSIFCYALDDKGIYVIDGQQRITTLYLLLNALRLIENEKFNDLKVSFFDNEFAKFDTREASPFCHHLFIENNIDEINKCLLKEPSKDFTKVNLYFGQEYICQYLKKSSKLKENLSKILRNLEMILIYCENVTFGYKIFENINSKGQALNNVDLIKTAFFSRIKNVRGVKDDFESYKYKIWKKIEEKFYTCPSANDTFEILGRKNIKAISNFHQMFAYYNQLKFGKKHNRKSRQLYSDYVLKLDGMSQEELKAELNEILNITNIYYYIINPFDKADTTIEGVQRSISFLDSLRIKVYIPFAIAIINKLEGLKYRNNKREIQELFYKLSIFHFIFNAVYSARPSIVEGKYNSLAHSIYVDDIKFKDLENQVVTILKETLERNVDLTNFDKNLRRVLFTTDRTGEKLRKNNSYKKYKDRFQIEFLLGVIEMILKNDYSSIPAIDTIEHINCLEDSGKDEPYNFCIFNFLPLERSLNNDGGAKQLPEKISLYKKSNYVLTKKFCEYYAKYKDDESMLRKEWEKEIIEILLYEFLSINRN